MGLSWTAGSGRISDCCVGRAQAEAYATWTHTTEQLTKTGRGAKNYVEAHFFLAWGDGACILRWRTCSVRGEQESLKEDESKN
jgi:hypothetical protein